MNDRIRAPVFLPDDRPKFISEPLPLGSFMKAWCREFVVERLCTCGRVTKAIRWIPDEMVLCRECADAEEAELKAKAKGVVNDTAKLASKLKRCGLDKQDRMLRDLHLNLDDPASILTGWQRARLPKQGPKTRYSATIARVNAYLDAVSRGTLVLSGPSGTGKSTCAAFCAWHSHGYYLPREKWSSIAPWEQDEIVWIRQHGGIVVLDEVCVMHGGNLTDRDNAVEIVGMIVKGRHAAGLPTILTTNATREEFLEKYGSLGEAIWRRANVDLAGAELGGGFYECGAKT